MPADEESVKLIIFSLFISMSIKKLAQKQTSIVAAFAVGLVALFAVVAFVFGQAGLTQAAANPK